MKKNVQSTVFIGGRKNSEEAKERKNAYLFYCQNHRINNLGCYGESWDSDDGERTAEEYIHSNRPLPDCFICANDNNTAKIPLAFQLNFELFCNTSLSI